MWGMPPHHSVIACFRAPLSLRSCDEGWPSAPLRSLMRRDDVVIDPDSLPLLVVPEQRRFPRTTKLGTIANKAIWPLHQRYSKTCWNSCEIPSSSAGCHSAPEVTE